MKKDIFIHIGTHKTGTTSIQQALANNYELLLQKGILYPSTEREPWPNLPKHTSIYASIRSKNKDNFLNEIDTLKKEIEDSNCNIIILSEEGLSEPNIDIINFFRFFINDFNLHVICYFRRQDYFVESLYNQFVRERVRSETRDIISFMYSPDIINRLDYYSILENWRSITENIYAYNFDDEILTNGLLSSFFNHFNIENLEIKDKKSNRSPDMEFILILSKMNKYGFDLNLNKLLHASRNIEKSKFFRKNKFLLGKVNRINLIEHCKNSNELLHNHYGIEFSNALPEENHFFMHDDISIEYCLLLLSELSQLK